MKRMTLFGILAFPILCLLASIGVLGMASSYQQNHALALQAQATLTQAQVTQSLVSTQQVLLAFAGIMVLLLIIETVVGAWMLLHMRNATQPKQSKWAPGPNARWGRIKSTNNVSLPDAQTLLTLALMERLLPLQPTQMPQQLPARGAEAGEQAVVATSTDEEEDDDFWRWWWAQRG